MKSYTPKENIMSLIEEHNSKEAIIEYINENKLSLTEIEFIQEVELPFCDNKIKECIEATNGNLQGYFIDRKKALENILSEFQNKLPQPLDRETDTEKIGTKHYVLTYLFDCNARGESYPIGNKKELERIGNELIEEGKGNYFYKIFNKIINKDLNVENNLSEIGGKNWRKKVVRLSKDPILVEKYLQSKQL